MGYSFDDYFDVADVELQEYISEGNLSSLTKQMLSFYSDRAEYEQRYGPIYGDDAIEIGEASRWAKYLPETVNELNRIKNQKEVRQPENAGFFRIGTVDLSIPPIQISVNDIKNNYTYQTLRTNSDITFSSGHTSKIIEMDVYFNGIDEINGKLRPLLAQLRASPFTPLYNDYLRSIILPQGKDIKFVDEEGKESTIAKALLDNEDRKRSTIESILNSASLVSSSMAHDVSKYFYRSEDEYIYPAFNGKNSLTENIKYAVVNYYGNIDEASGETVSDYTKDITINPATGYAAKTEQEIIGQTKGLIEQAKKAEEELKHLEKVYSDLFSKMTINNKDTGDLAGVLSQMTVSTVQGFPESLLCHFTFFVFNYAPFSQGFNFITWDNLSTPDIDDCEYFVKWYSDRFLNKKGKKDPYMKKLDESLGGYVKFRFDTTPVDDFEVLENDERKNYFELATDDNNVCSSITVSNKNNIAFMPILAWSMPTCQYIGRNSSEILLTFDVSEDVFLEKMKFLTEVIDLTSRTNTDKGRRNNYVEVDNEILRLNGIRNCVIQSIDTTTVPGQPGLNRINVRLVEFNKNQLKAEILTISDGLTRERLLALYDVAFEGLPDGKRETDEFPVLKALDDAAMVYEETDISIAVQERRGLLSTNGMTGYLSMTESEDARLKVANKVPNARDISLGVPPTPVGGTPTGSEIVSSFVDLSRNPDAGQIIR
ncbi:MAG: hypothetical protein DRP42_05785, partial [Tenericutes bacterium]